MSAVSFLKQFQVELKKGEQGLPILMTIALLLGNLAYLYFGLSRGDAISIGERWERTYFYIPPMNTLLLSLFMAVLVSLSMDLEHKGNTWNLLQTMQSRRSIFLCKTLYGLLYAVTFVIAQQIAIIAIGKAPGFNSVPPISAVIISTIAQILSGMVVYQIGGLLSLLFSSQFAAISINLGGILAGMFLLLVTTKPVTPWSILGSLEVAEMNFDISSETVSFTWYHAPRTSWMVGILYFVVIFLTGLILYTRMEEGSIPGLGTGIVKSSPLHTSAPAEILKLKRSPIWIPFFVIPIISAAIGTFNFRGNQGTLSFTWESLWTQHSLFLGAFFLPPLIATLCSLLLRQEHNGTNWNLMLTLASPRKIIRDKMLVSSGISVTCMHKQLIAENDNSIYAQEGKIAQGEQRLDKLKAGAENAKKSLDKTNEKVKAQREKLDIQKKEIKELNIKILSKQEVQDLPEPDTTFDGKYYKVPKKEYRRILATAQQADVIKRKNERVEKRQRGTEYLSSRYCECELASTRVAAICPIGHRPISNGQIAVPLQNA